MPKSSNSVASRKRRKKILKKAKGYFGRRKNVYTIAKNAVEKGLSYSELIHKLKIQGVEINRKVLADIAMNDPEKFSSIIKNLKA